MNVDTGKVCASSILPVGCDEDVQTKWEFERAQLLATGATTKGLSERHSGLRINPAAEHSALCPWEGAGACVHSVTGWDGATERGFPLLPGDVLGASSLLFTVLCRNGPFPVGTRAC